MFRDLTVCDCTPTATPKDNSGFAVNMRKKHENLMGELAFLHKQRFVATLCSHRFLNRVVFCWIR